MNQRDITAMVAVVRAIKAGQWTDEPPVWADRERYSACIEGSDDAAVYLRAVWTAEAFVILAQQQDKYFPVKTFLARCGFTS